MKRDTESIICSVKHLATRMVVEQGADVSSFFRTLNKLAKSTTAKNLPNNGFKKILYNALK